MKLGTFAEKFAKILGSTDPQVKKTPRLLLGPPGIGKTSTFRYLAKKFGYKFYQVILSRKRPEHLEGIIAPGRTTEYAGYRTAVKLLPDLYRYVTSAPKVIVLFDELNTAHPDVLNAALTIFSEFEIAGERLDGREVLLVAAGNTVSSGAAYVEPLRAVISTRFQVIYVEPDYGYLVRTGLAKTLYHPIVNAYLLKYPDKFYVPAPADTDGTNTAPQITTPRGWETLSKLIQHQIIQPYDLEVIRGTIGTVAENFARFWDQFGKEIMEAITTGNSTRWHEVITLYR